MLWACSPGAGGGGGGGGNVGGGTGGFGGGSVGGGSGGSGGGSVGGGSGGGSAGGSGGGSTGGSGGSGGGSTGGSGGGNIGGGGGNIGGGGGSTGGSGGGSTGGSGGGSTGGSGGGNIGGGGGSTGGSGGGAPYDGGTPDAVIAVDLTSPGASVPDDFLGLSVEWSHVTDYLGDTSGQARPEVVQLLKNFAVDGHVPVLRIGGNSEDQSYWNPDAGTLPSGASVSVGPTQLAVLTALSNATGVHFVLGLNLARNDATNAAALVQAALSALPTGSIDAFELGNEPDLYALTGARPIYYSTLFYQSDFDGYFPQLSNAASGQPLFAAPAVYGTTWFSGLASFLSAEQGRLGLVTVHRYPYDVCIFGTVGAPTLPSLFQPTATTGYATTFAPVVQTAAQAGLKLRVAEMNSISCGGVQGVSDVFASGLWGADAMFEVASVGGAGVNLHTPGHYPVFDFTPQGNLEVRGLYYGMWLFSRATAQQGRWLPVTVQSALQVRAWATLGSDGVARVALINEDLQSSAVAAVTLAGRTSAGSAWHLTAPTLDTATQITFGTQTFEGSTDGAPLGSPAADVPPSSGGTYWLTLSPGSAALLAVP